MSMKTLNEYMQIASTKKYYRLLSDRKLALLKQLVDELILMKSEYIELELQNIIYDIYKLRRPDEISEKMKESVERTNEMRGIYPEMSKEEEIRLLKELCSHDTYFGMSYRKHLKQMIWNIQSDVPVDMSIDQTHELNKLRTEVSNLSREKILLKNNKEKFENRVSYLEKQLKETREILSKIKDLL